MDTTLSKRDQSWMRYPHFIDFGICQFFLLHCGIENPPMSSSSRNRKFAKSVLRIVFKSLETFLESLQLSHLNEMHSKLTRDFT